jgi:hypothetical protein
MLFRIVEFCTQTKDCAIYAVKENQAIKKNDAVSAIILSAYGTAAQIERDMIVKRTKDGLERRKQMGVILGRPIGSRTRSMCKRYEELKGQVENLLAKKVSITGISRTVGLHRNSLMALIARYNLPYVKKRIRHIDDFAQRILSGKMHLLRKLIEDGKAIKDIHSFVNGQGYELSYGAVSGFIRSRHDLYSMMIAKNKDLRVIHNKDCGRDRRYYNF